MHSLRGLGQRPHLGAGASPRFLGATTAVMVLSLGCLDATLDDEVPASGSANEEASPSNGPAAGSPSRSPEAPIAMTGDTMMSSQDDSATDTTEPMSQSESEQAADGGPLMSLLNDVNSFGEEGVYSGMTLAHNLIRAELNDVEPLPPLQWDSELSAYAQQWSDELASRCNSIEHRDQNSYGENIAMRGSRPGPVTFPAEDAVNGWAAEIACWQFGTIVGGSSEGGSPGQESCNLQCANDLFANGCGHYTQLVWRNSERVGCGYSTCEANGFDYGIWVCNYDPPGNFIGQEPY